MKVLIVDNKDSFTYNLKHYINQFCDDVDVVRYNKLQIGDVGEYDKRVPVQHSIILHRALNVYLGIDTELVIYPGEGHGLSKHSHRMAKLKWDMAWFEKYLK